MARRARNAKGELLESAWQDQVVGLARFYGWDRIFHAPQQGAGGRAFRQYPEGTGFPDLVLVRPPELIFAELKAEGGRVSTTQQAWLDALAEVDGASVYLWRPGDWHEVERILARGRHLVPTPAPE